jgi:metal-responsive CopG/Arc/MetJ family transcriptional regulator
MRTIQMTLDDQLVDAVDKVIKKLHTTRSAFTRIALREALKKVRLQHQEERHRKGYEQSPVQNDEFSVWEKEQVWGDE